MGKPRITLLARADNTGLGVQTWEFFRNIQPEHTFVIDLTEINRQHNKKTELYPERFPGAQIIDGFPNEAQMHQICEDTDMIFTVEIPYGYRLFEIAREHGVKTVLQYNFEFLDYLNQPELPRPDLFLAPSPWRLMDAMRIGGRGKVKYLPVPTERERLPFKPRTKAEHFLHIAGHPAHEDRNGTWVVMNAMQYVKRPIELTIKTQNKDLARELLVSAASRMPDYVKMYIDDTEAENYWENYDDKFDVLLLPRKYGGLSLQRNEAVSGGMPVVMSEIDPNILTLPPELLVTAHQSKQTMTRTMIDVFETDPLALAERIDWLYDNPNDVQRLSHLMNKIAEDSSWEAMAPLYMKEFETLCQQ